MLLPQSPALYACEAYGLRLTHEGDNQWSGTLTCWLVDADGVCLDESGDDAVDCSLAYDADHGGLDVYGPDGSPIALHPTTLGEIDRKCGEHVEWWIESERAERRAEDREDFYRGDWR